MNQSNDIVIHHSAAGGRRGMSSSLMNTQDMYAAHDNKYNMALHTTHQEMVQQTFDLLSEQTSNKYENQIQTNVFYKSAQEAKHELDAFNTVVKDLCARLQLPVETVLELVEETKDRNICEEEKRIALKGILTLANKICDQIIHLTTSYKKLITTHPDIPEDMIKTALGKEYLYTIIKIELKNEKRSQKRYPNLVVDNIDKELLNMLDEASLSDEVTSSHEANSSDDQQMSGNPMERSTYTNESVNTTHPDGSPRESHVPSEATLGM